MWLLQVTHTIPWTSNIWDRNLPIETKIQEILDLALSSNGTQVRYMLELASYYRKLIPMFSLIVSPITFLPKKNGPFVAFCWTAACQTALDTINHAITNSPVLIYPDPNKWYHLFTGASNHARSGVLTQTGETWKENGKLYINYHPIMYQSGTFTLSQINWSTLVKEVYAIMMLFHKIAFCLHGVEVVIRLDHAPLQKLIKNKTTNVLTQNWVLELFSISPHITFQYIKGKDNILADSVSHLQQLGLYERRPQNNLAKNTALLYFIKVKPFMNMHNQKTSHPKSRYGNTCYWLQQRSVYKW